MLSVFKYARENKNQPRFKFKFYLKDQYGQRTFF